MRLITEAVMRRAVALASTPVRAAAKRAIEAMITNGWTEVVLARKFVVDQSHSLRLV